MKPTIGARIILVDVAHPAHVHFYRGLIDELQTNGLRTQIVARDKDVTLDLLNSLGYEYVVPRAKRSERASLAAIAELFGRSMEIREIAVQTQAKVILTRNPSGVLAAVGTEARSVFDTDDGRSAGTHYWLARPFADVVTSSCLDPENHGPRHRRYPGLKAQMGFHTRHFRADEGVRERYGIANELLFVVRFSAYTAVHDRKARGIPSAVRTEVIRRLSASGAVLVSQEGQGNCLKLRGGIDAGVLVPPHDFHNLLAASNIYVGDSQSVAAEAAVLGVPTLHMSSFSDRLFYLGFLERRQLIQSFTPGSERAFLSALDLLMLNTETSWQTSQQAAVALNEELGDPLAWYFDLILEQLMAR